MKRVVHYRVLTDSRGNGVLNEELRALLIPGTVIWILYSMLQPLKGEWFGFHSVVQSFVLYIKTSGRLEKWEDEHWLQIQVALAELVEFGALEVREFD